MSLTRREFIRKSVLTIGSISLLPSVAFSQTVTRRKIAVIGAGLAGLSAAYELAKAGHDVIILEAQNRIGGRIFTVRESFADNLYAEAGASRIPIDHEFTHKYIAEFNLPLAPFYPTSGNFVRLKNGTAQPVGWKKFAEATEVVMQLGKPEFWRKIKGGNDQLPKAFAARLAGKIKLNAPVVKISQNETSVKVNFKENDKIETMTADFLICAIPFTTLKKIEIAANISAPKREIIEKLKYDSASRVLLQMRRRFWEDSGLNGFAFGAENTEIWNAGLGQNGARGILQTYLRGEVSERLTALAPSERLTKTVADLEQIFPRCRENFEIGLSKCWSEDAWVQGAWAHPNDKELKIIKESENRIFFAGEHASEWASWMQGALQSGNRVAQEINQAALLKV